MADKKRSLGDRVFRSVLRILPFDFRSDFGREMEDVFHEQRRVVEESGGKAGFLRLWWETLTGIFQTAPRQHWEIFQQDAGYALRVMRKNLGFTAVAVITLAFGIGANTAIFSVVNGVLLRPLPYTHGEQLIHVIQKAPLINNDPVSFSVKEIADYREQNHTLAGLVEYHSMTFTLLGNGDPERVVTGVVSANFFDLFGVQPMFGRSFRESDDQLGAEAVLILSNGYWKNKLGGDPNVVGRTFSMNDRVHTVVGVLPPIPQFPDENDVYMPTSACPFRSSKQMLENRDHRMMDIFARVKPDVSLAQAQADLASIASWQDKDYPEAYPKKYGHAVEVAPLKEELTSHARPTLLILLGTAGLVLLLACANVANLTLSRQLRRSQELAVRTALGANRARLFRQLLTESTLLAFAGGVLGLLMAYAGLDLLVAFAAKFTPRTGQIAIDGWVLLFALLISVVTGIMFGTIPAFHSMKDPAGALKEGRGQGGLGTGRHRIRNMLVVAQVAVSVILLVGAGLMLRSLSKLLEVPAGYNPENVLSMRLSLNWSKYTTPQIRSSFYDQLLNRVSVLPGVRTAAVSMTVPLNGDSDFSNGPLSISGRPPAEGAPEPMVDYRVVSADYFSTTGIPLLAGRAFTNADRTEAPLVTIVNQHMARHFWNTASPVGEKISSDGGKHWSTIVGVIGDVRQYGLDHDPVDEVYLSLFQNPLGSANLLVRTAMNPMSMARDVAKSVYRIDPQQPVARIATLEQLRSESLASPRLTAILLGLFAGLALLITLAGIIGALSLSVSQRTNEIGIRMALGATPGRISRMVMGQGLFLVLAGLAVGIAVSLALSRLMSSLLFGIQPTDPLTFSAVAAVSIAVAALACFWPAHRATRIDPMTALRSE
jgi:putative ABC transport system permease protein